MGASDPSARVRFAPSRGAVESAERERLVVLPATVLAALAREAGPAALAALGAELGRSVGARLAARAGSLAAVGASPFEAVVDELALELALAGLGVASVQRWDRALVIAVREAPVPHARFLEEVLAGALGALAGQPVAAAFVGFEGDRLRFFVGRAETAARVRAEAEHASLGVALERLVSGELT